MLWHALSRTHGAEPCSRTPCPSQALIPRLECSESFPGEGGRTREQFGSPGDCLDALILGRDWKLKKILDRHVFLKLVAFLIGKLSSGSVSVRSGVSVHR